MQGPAAAASTGGMFAFKDDSEGDSVKLSSTSSSQQNMQSEQLISKSKSTYCQEPQLLDTNGIHKLHSVVEQPVGLFKIGFEDLNQDFKVPEGVFRKVKKLGKGAYGKVMQVCHIPTNKKYAMKRYE